MMCLCVAPLLTGPPSCPSQGGVLPGCHAHHTPHHHCPVIETTCARMYGMHHNLVCLCRGNWAIIYESCKEG